MSNTIEASKTQGVFKSQQVRFFNGERGFKNMSEKMVTTLRSDLGCYTTLLDSDPEVTDVHERNAILQMCRKLEIYVNYVGEQVSRERAKVLKELLNGEDDCSMLPLSGLSMMKTEYIGCIADSEEEGTLWFTACLDRHGYIRFGIIWKQLFERGDIIRKDYNEMLVQMPVHWFIVGDFFKENTNHSQLARGSQVSLEVYEGVKQAVVNINEAMHQGVLQWFNWSKYTVGRTFMKPSTVFNNNLFLTTAEGTFIPQEWSSFEARKDGYNMLSNYDAQVETDFSYISTQGRHTCGASELGCNIFNGVAGEMSDTAEEMKNADINMEVNCHIKTWTLTFSKLYQLGEMCCFPFDNHMTCNEFTAKEIHLDRSFFSRLVIGNNRTALFNGPRVYQRRLRPGSQNTPGHPEDNVDYTMAMTHAHDITDYYYWVEGGNSHMMIYDSEAAVSDTVVKKVSAHPVYVRMADQQSGMEVFWCGVLMHREMESEFKWGKTWQGLLGQMSLIAWESKLVWLIQSPGSFTNFGNYLRFIARYVFTDQKVRSKYNLPPCYDRTVKFKEPTKLHKWPVPMRRIALRQFYTRTVLPRAFKKWPPLTSTFYNAVPQKRSLGLRIDRESKRVRRRLVELAENYEVEKVDTVNLLADSIDTMVPDVRFKGQ